MCTSVEQGRKTIPGANMKKWRDHQLPGANIEKRHQRRKSVPRAKKQFKARTLTHQLLRHRHDVFTVFHGKPRSRSRSSHQVLDHWCLHVPPSQQLYSSHDAPSSSSSHAPGSITTLMFPGSSHAPGPTHRLRSGSQYGPKARPG